MPVFAAFGSYSCLSKSFTFPWTLRRAEHQNLALSIFTVKLFFSGPRIRIIVEDNANAEELEPNFGTKKPVDKCQRKIKYLLHKYEDANQWNRNQSGGHIRKSVFYDKIDRVLDVYILYSASKVT